MLPQDSIALWTDLPPFVWAQRHAAQRVGRHRRL